ncbi:ACR3 family arsenite efflux transporter [Conexibacter stalactiti]|uniref:ACR3 family arsenite efflux transporter n=1 Tax=Conexibacter stalactiti TaxID=1940611 RepID=A0ABU4HU13_9ACTN|nr:ACR3 family arsenite efflux transporter [Conexibacter stalactiti]MDW5596817.1 ACR3 family arsenite efflux transporter [Conexibacter stalactiti]MEC5037459.1 ACR3 family arsenite efflux transporter [Conexibacter stalactiti]
MTSTSSPHRAPAAEAVAGRLSTLDRFLPLWIAVAMAVGLGLGALIPGFDDALEALQIGTVSLPIALGLLLMMYPVLAKVRYEELGRLRGERRLIVSSLVLNWIVGPLLMFAVAWIFLADQPEYRTGLIVVGLARCIAMVLIWTELACADREATALLVAINSLFQIVAYSLLGWFYLTALPDLLGLDAQGFEVSMWEVARTVLIFLGIPLLAGWLTRVVGVRRRGADWYEQRFLPRIGPLALYGLLFTIALLFALQGDAIADAPLDVARIALPLLVYFTLMFALSFLAGVRLGLGYERTATLAFTAASNNFELAIAVAIGVWGATSGQALAGVVGPLIEVPVLVALVYVALWMRRRWFADAPAPHDAPARPQLAKETT